MRKVHSTAHLVKPYVNVALYLIYQVITTNFGGNGPEAIFKVGDVNRKQHISQTTVSMSHKNMMWNTIALAASLKNNTARERSSNFIIQLLQYPSSFMSYRQRKIRGGGEKKQKKKGNFETIFVSGICSLVFKITLQQDCFIFSSTLLSLPVLCVFWNSAPIPLYRENETRYAIPTQTIKMVLLHFLMNVCKCV